VWRGRESRVGLETTTQRNERKNDGELPRNVRVTHVADHRPDVALGVPPPRLPPAVLDVPQVLPELRVPPVNVALVAAVYSAPPRYFHVGVGEHELVRGGVEGEAVRPPPEGEYERGRGGVQAVPGR